MFIKQIDGENSPGTGGERSGGYGACPRGKGTEMGKHDAGHVAKDAGRLFVLPEGAGDGERRD